MIAFADLVFTILFEDKDLRNKLFIKLKELKDDNNNVVINNIIINKLFFVESQDTNIVFIGRVEDLTDDTIVELFKYFASYNIINVVATYNNNIQNNFITYKYENNKITKHSLDDSLLTQVIQDNEKLFQEQDPQLLQKGQIDCTNFLKKIFEENAKVEEIPF